MRQFRQFSFLNGPNKLAFVRMYGSTITGLVGHHTLTIHLQLFVIFCAFLCPIARTKTLTSKN